jgi:hypothetical protein
LFRVSISLLILEILIAEKDNMSRSCCRCLLTLSGLARNVEPRFHVLTKAAAEKYG